MTVKAMHMAGRLLARFRRDERGATAIEYALIAVGIAIAVSAMVFQTGATVKTDLYSKIDEGMK